MFISFTLSPSTASLSFLPFSQTNHIPTPFFSSTSFRSFGSFFSSTSLFTHHTLSLLSIMILWELMKPYREEFVMFVPLVFPQDITCSDVFLCFSFQDRCSSSSLLFPSLNLALFLLVIPFPLRPLYHPVSLSVSCWDPPSVPASILLSLRWIMAAYSLVDANQVYPDRGRSLGYQQLHTLTLAYSCTVCALAHFQSTSSLRIKHMFVSTVRWPTA